MLEVQIPLNLDELARVSSCMKKLRFCGQCLPTLFETLSFQMHGTFKKEIFDVKIMDNQILSCRFFFELMVKSMVECLGSSQKLDSPRKQRFPERFLEDVGRLVSLVTSEILLRQRRDGSDSKVDINLSLKLSVEFFLNFSILLLECVYFEHPSFFLSS